MTILIVALILTLIVATFASSFCRGATVVLPKDTNCQAIYNGTNDTTYRPNRDATYAAINAAWNATNSHT